MTKKISRVRGPLSRGGSQLAQALAGSRMRSGLAINAISDDFLKAQYPVDVDFEDCFKFLDFRESPCWQRDNVPNNIKPQANGILFEPMKVEDENIFIYHDAGAGYFDGSFDVEFTCRIKIDDKIGSTTVKPYISIQDEFPSAPDPPNGDNVVAFYTQAAVDGQANFVLRVAKDPTFNTTFTTDLITWPFQRWIHFKWTTSDSKCRIYIYRDRAMTDLEDSLEVDDAGINPRYFMPYSQDQLTVIAGNGLVGAHDQFDFIQGF